MCIRAVPSLFSMHVIPWYRLSRVHILPIRLLMEGGGGCLLLVCLDLQWCPRLHSFWSAIFATLSDVLQLPIDPSPVISLFGVLPETIPLTKYQCDLVAFVTLLARRLILMHWKKNISTFTFTHTHCVAQSPNSVKYGSPFCPMLTALPSSPRSSLNSGHLTSIT